MISRGASVCFIFFITIIGLKFLPIIFESTGKMHPLLQDFLAVVMDFVQLLMNPRGCVIFLYAISLKSLRSPRYVIAQALSMSMDWIIDDYTHM